MTLISTPKLRRGVGKVNPRCLIRLQLLERVARLGNGLGHLRPGMPPRVRKEEPVPARGELRVDQRPRQNRLEEPREIDDMYMPDGRRPGRNVLRPPCLDGVPDHEGDLL